MSRLIFIPQFPGRMRYTEWWLDRFKNEFEKQFDGVVVLGEKYAKENSARADLKWFSPIDEAIKLEMIQIQEYLNLKLQDNDILFLADLSFPGLFTSVLFHKRCPKMFVYCHATAKNAYDYWWLVRKMKWKVEVGHSELFDCVFVSTEYHKNLLKLPNIKVVGLPHPPDWIINRVYYSEREFNIVSVCRPSIQKVNKKLEKFVEQYFGKIHRYTFDRWIDYCSFLSKSKILLITTKAETFNYTILDAIKCGCIPIAPNKLCFPEILPREYLYNDAPELIRRIYHILNNDEEVPVPDILCEDNVNNFYNRICEIMKG